MSLATTYTVPAPSVLLPTTLDPVASFTTGVGGPQSKAAASWAAGISHRSEPLTTHPFDLDGKLAQLQHTLNWIQLHVPGASSLLSNSSLGDPTGTVPLMHESASSQADRVSLLDRDSLLSIQATLEEIVAQVDLCVDIDAPKSETKAAAREDPFDPQQAEAAQCLAETVALFSEAQDLATVFDSVPKEMQGQVEHVLLKLLKDTQPEGEEIADVIMKVGGLAEIANGILKANKSDLDKVRAMVRDADAASSASPDVPPSKKEGPDGGTIATYTVFGLLGFIWILIGGFLLHRRYHRTINLWINWIRDAIRQTIANFRQVLQTVLDAIPR
jgi:hypothetical protein